MDEEPLFLFEDEEHYKKLDDIAKSLVLKDEKVSKEAVFLKQMLRAAMRPKEEKKKGKTFEDRKSMKGVDFNKIFGEKINPITNPQKEIQVRMKKPVKQQKVPTSLPPLAGLNSPEIEEIEPIEVPSPQSKKDKKDKGEPDIPSP